MLRSLRVAATLALALPLTACIHIDLAWPLPVLVRGGGDQPLEIAYIPGQEDADYPIAPFVRSLAADPEIARADRLIFADGLATAIYFDADEDQSGLHTLRGRTAIDGGVIAFEIPGVSRAGFASAQTLWVSASGQTTLRDPRGFIIGAPIEHEFVQVITCADHTFGVTSGGLLARWRPLVGQCEVLPNIGQVRFIALHDDRHIAVQQDPTGVVVLDGETLEPLWRDEAVFLSPFVSSAMFLKHDTGEGAEIVRHIELSTDPATNRLRPTETSETVYLDRAIPPDAAQEALFSLSPLMPTSGFIWGRLAPLHGTGAQFLEAMVFPLTGASLDGPLSFEQRWSQAPSEWLYLMPHAPLKSRQ